MLFDRAELIMVNRGIDRGWDVSVYAYEGLDASAMETASYFATPVMGVGAEDKGLRWDGMAKAVEAGEAAYGAEDVRGAVREAVELIAKCSDGLSSSDQCQLVELAGSVALRGGRPLALVKSLAADRDASEGQPNGIGFYGLVRNVRDAALASIDAGGDFVAVGKDVSRAILGASMPSARAAWSIASDIATRTAASAAEKGLRCPARHMLASGAEGAARAAAPSRGAGR